MQRCEPIKLDDARETSKLNNKFREVNLKQNMRMRLLVDLTREREIERVNKKRVSERKRKMQSKTTI